MELQLGLPDDWPVGQHRHAPPEPTGEWVLSSPLPDLPQPRQLFSRFMRRPKSRFVQAPDSPAGLGQLSGL